MVLVRVLVKILVKVNVLLGASDPFVEDGEGV
jgi:hypothetical protein